MTTKSFGRVFLVVAALGLIPSAGFADEIVHFTNGAEMAVRSHSVEKDKHTVRLDLGGNSFIAFPMSMVDKIESAGQDVFLNPVFHPSNQAIAGGTSGPVPESAYRSSAAPAGRPGPNVRQGAMLGEAADPVPYGVIAGPSVENTVANSRRIYNPASPAPRGGQPQVVMPPGMTVRPPVAMAMIPTRPAEPVTPPTPPVTAPTPPEDPPATDPPAEDPPDTP